MRSFACSQRTLRFYRFSFKFVKLNLNLNLNLILTLYKYEATLPYSHNILYINTC
jgi:hypothetical protein